jgi:uncharacterized protein YlxW (UPF0749 family)
VDGGTTFNPLSVDAMFSRILERLDSQEKDQEKRHTENVTELREIRAQTTATNGRVTKLEKTAATVDQVKKLEDQRNTFTGYIAAITTIAGIAWALFVHFTR